MCFFFYFSIGKQQGDMGVALLVHYTTWQSEHTAAKKEVARAELLASGLAIAGSPRVPHGENIPRSTRRCRHLTRRRLHSLASFNAVREDVLCKYILRCRRHSNVRCTCPNVLESGWWPCAGVWEKMYISCMFDIYHFEMRYSLLWGELILFFGFSM